MSHNNRIVGHLTDEQKSMFDQIKTRRGGISSSQMVALLVVEEFRRMSGTNSKEQTLARIERKLNLLLTMLWANRPDDGPVVVNRDEITKMLAAIEEGA